MAFLEAQGMTIDEVTNRDMAKWKAPSDKQVQEAFNAFDIDGSGDIDLYEIQVALAKYWGVQLTEKEALSVMTLYDGDGNGTLDIDEFRVMLANLEDLDPAAISRFWLSQVAAVPGARQFVEGVGSMKKIGDHLGNKLAKSARVNDTARWALEIQRHERERKLKKKERRQRREQEGRTVGEDDNVLALRRSSTGRF
eukprot:g4177.t1